MTDHSKRPSSFDALEFEQGPTLLFAWRRKWIVLLLTCVGLGLGYLYFLREVPVYQSAAQILLVQRQAKLPVEGLEVRTGYEGKTTGPDLTHESVISSPAVAKLAVEKHGLASLPTFQASGDPALRLIGGLDVKLGGVKRNKGDIIELKFNSVNAADCPKVLEAVVEAYQSFLGSTYQDVSGEAIELIVKAKDELDRQLSETEAAYRKFRFDVPLLFGKTEGQNMHEVRLEQIEEVRSAAVLQNAKTQAKIEAIEHALQRSGSRAALKLMVGHVSEGKVGEELTRGASPLEKELFPALLEEQMLLESYGPDHPKVVAMRKKISMTKEYLVGATTANTDTKPADFLDIYLDSLREELRLNKQTIAEMDTLFTTEREASKSLAMHQVSDDTFRSELDRKRRLFDAVVKRLEEINLVKETGKVRIQLIQPPRVGVQIQPNFMKIMLCGGLLGLIGGLGLALMIDRADRRFRSPDEIREELGIPVVGHIPVIEASKKHAANADGDADTKTAPILCTIHHPRGRDAEAYRAVRTSLFYGTRGAGHQVIQITSASPADGKTTLAGNLAVSIAQSGKSVLLLDADFRRPRCHRLFGVENSKGVVEVLNESIDLTDALQATSVPNLSLLPSGHRPDNPSEILTSTGFEKLIHVLREKFEFVIVDTPPVLVVTDPLNVVPHVDGLMLVMRLTKTARSSVARATATLHDLGAKVLGVVVNGVGGGSITGYGAYNGYGYGYGSGYGYGKEYGYGYGDRSHKKYYEEAESSENEPVHPTSNNGDSQGARVKT